MGTVFGSIAPAAVDPSRTRVASASAYPPGSLIAPAAVDPYRTRVAPDAAHPSGSLIAPDSIAPDLCRTRIEPYRR